LAGCIGDDPAGAAMRAELAAGGVDVAALRAVTGPSGMSVAIIQDDGAYGAVIISAANRVFDGAGVALPPGCTAVLLQSEVSAAANLVMARLAKAGGAQVIWNAAPARPDAALLALTDILIVNRVEAADLLGRPPDDPLEGVAALAALGVPRVILTLGEAGAAWWDGAALHMPAHPVRVRSTHGAGDAFCGALAAALDGGATLADAVATGQRAAAAKVSG
jgi:ribokinase